ncbi:MAG TPA: hypothetical protein EYO14_03640 [Candidatus Nitrosopelagicus sp.]|nr:hypothetical protein [Candidatus Nitrosopelagicus sp.]
MKNYFVVISIMIIFLIPLNVSAISEEAWQEWLKGDINYRVNIEYENQPHAYAYIALRNSNGELVGVSHVTASQYLEHPIFYAFLNEQPVIQNVTIEGTQYEMKVIPAEFNIHPAFCFDQKGMGQGNIHDLCFFYTFTSKLDASFEVKNQKHRITAFSGLHHGFLTEGGDRINMNWTALIPIN